MGEREASPEIYKTSRAWQTGRVLPIAERAARLALNLRGFESRMIQTRAAAMHVYDALGAGNFPTTVVLHGMGSAATPFARVLTRLRTSCRRVIAPDMPGHGFSTLPRTPISPQILFEALCDALVHLEREPVVLVGSSLGGAFALRYALEHPERVRALVLISPAGAQMSDDEWRVLLDTFRVESTREARVLLERLYHRAPLYAPLFAAGLRDSLQRPVVRDILRTTTPADLPAPERLRELAMPVLLLWGQSERILPASSLAYFRRHLPEHAVVEEPAGFGHCPHIEDPGRLSARVIAFLSSVADY